MTNVGWLPLVGLLVFAKCQAYFLPCNGSSPLDGSCDVDDDCAGTGVVCTLGKCQCDFAYARSTDQGQYSSAAVCLKVPDTIGAPCVNSCRFPLFCDNNRCQCIRSKQEGEQCFVDSYLGQSCKRHIECTIPFSACVDRHCNCIKGTVRRGNSCHAAAHCPFGGQVGEPCTLSTVDSAMAHNVLNSGGVLDTCKFGHFCFAPASSLTGNCCPVSCPLSTKPSLEYNCDVRTNDGRTCPWETHFCHRVAGASFSYSVCCKHPCREPKPVYIKGNCYARSYLGGPCQLDAQCDGGDSMQCQGEVCSCRGNFRPEHTEHSSATPLRCVPSQCPTSDGLLQHDCLEKASLGEQCISSVQCPSGAHCFRGLCFCQCHTQRRGNKCVLDAGGQQQTLRTPGPVAGEGFLTGMRGGSAGQQGGGLFNVVQNILKGVRGNNG